MELLSTNRVPTKPWVRILRYIQTLAGAGVGFSLFTYAQQRTTGFYSWISFDTFKINPYILTGSVCLILALIIQLALNNRPTVTITGRATFKIPRTGHLSTEEGNALSHRVEVRLKELLEEYQTRDINDPRVQEGLKSFINDISMKITDTNT